MPKSPCGCPRCVASRERQAQSEKPKSYLESPPPDGYQMALNNKNQRTYESPNPAVPDG
jgi:hypothetical protein